MAMVCGCHFTGASAMHLPRRLLIGPQNHHRGCFYTAFSGVIHKILSAPTFKGTNFLGRGGGGVMESVPPYVPKLLKERLTRNLQTVEESVQTLEIFGFVRTDPHNVYVHSPSRGMKSIAVTVSPSRWSRN